MVDNPNMELYEKVRAVPEEAQKKIEGGRLKNMTNINPMWRIKTLTENFGECGVGWWTDNIQFNQSDGSSNEKVVICTLNLYTAKDGKTSAPIFGVGGSKLIAKEGGGMYTDDEAYKKAYTDAISVACKALGIGADVYYKQDVDKYTPLNAEKTPVNGKQTKTGNSASQAKTGETGGNNAFQYALNYEVEHKGKKYRLGDLNDSQLEWFESRANDELKKLINKVYASRMADDDGEAPF